MVNNAPLHGKKTFVFLQLANGSGLDLVSYATDFSISFTPRGVAYAHVLGTDAIPGVEAHGYAARGRVTLLLSTDMPYWLAALDNRASVLGDVEADFDTAATNFSGETEYHVASKLNMVIAILDTATPLDADSQIVNMTTLRKKVGYIWELNKAAIVALEPSGRVGEYVSVRLEVETGHWAGYENRTADV
jgi:hypothetical protein